MRRSTNPTGSATHTDPFDGWQTGLGEYQTYDDLPNETRSYIEAMESQLHRKFVMISLGPGRDEVIEKNY